MRDLLDRFGCLLQLAVGAGVFALLVTTTTLPLWGSVGLAIAGSFVGTWLLVVGVGWLVG